MAAEAKRGAPSNGGCNRIHAILDNSSSCIATHPSDMCVALAALDAAIHLNGPHGERIVPLTEFHRLPGGTPHLETNLQPGELITAIELPPLSIAKRSAHRKVGDWSSYAFALVSVATAVDLDGGCAIASFAGHEMGMGTATVQSQVVAERLGLGFDCVHIE